MADQTNGLLLDTHVWLWWVSQPNKLRPATRERITDPGLPVYISAVSVWEIAIKSASGKLDLPWNAQQFAQTSFDTDGFDPLPITWQHSAHVQQLPRHHTDPFDHALIAQAQWENLSLVTVDKQFLKYEVDLLRA